MDGPDWQLAGRPGVGLTDEAEAALARGVDNDPFMSLPWLRLDRGDRLGCLRNGKTWVPFASLAPGWMVLGGYINSEVSTVGVGPGSELAAAIATLPAALTRFGFHALSVELPNSEVTALGLRERFGGEGWTVQTIPGRRSPVVGFPPCSERGRFEDHFRAHHVSEFRKLAASERKLAALGDVEQVRHAGPFPEALVDELADVESRSWKRDVGLFNSARREQAMAAIRAAQVHLVLTRIDGRPVAWDLDIVKGRRCFSYNKCFDEAVRKTGVGKLLHFRNLEVAWNAGFAAVNLLGDADDVKRYLATGSVDRERLIAFAPTLAGRAHRAAFGAYQHVKAWRDRRAGRDA
ncbi:GNAT family N-acetyltransferase [Rhodospira trueperi]|uniref:Acetyltransferase (GNAT) domain-containing protein n=1 Tax=Rhodospira trueperi TaxID=69960 RepID=A0A1G7BYB7_9PROT|nr:GNAT family N-acetyltransferase [Rhodospira trueperi]SDE32032.1 Acetyltransferase (GNAT) domain-containing protein [Rhodospira trueperi]